MNSFYKSIALGFVVTLFVIPLFFIRTDIPVEELIAEYAPPPSKFISLDGMNVHYRVEGEGPALVLLHGTSSSLHTWQGWTDALKSKYRIIRMDLPGFGLTGPRPDDDYRISTYVSFLNKLLKRLGIRKFALAGNSLGGHIAWEYALKYPEEVTKLILIDPTGYPEKRSKEPTIFKLARIPVVGTMLSLLTPRSLIESNLHEVYAVDSLVTPALVDRYYALARRAGNRDAFIARAKTPVASRFSEINQLTMPIFIQWGADDSWIPMNALRGFAEKLSNSIIITYPNAGHIPMEEIPLRTAHDADRFLKADIQN